MPEIFSPETAPTGIHSLRCPPVPQATVEGGGTGQPGYNVPDVGTPSDRQHLPPWRDGGLMGKHILLPIIGLLMVVSIVSAQQVPDLKYKPPLPKPAYEAGKGPR